MVVSVRFSRSKYLSFLIPFCLLLMFFVLLNNIETVKIIKISNAVGDRMVNKHPGAYLENFKPNSSAESFCKLNYGLPFELVYTTDHLSESPELGKNSPFYVLYNVIEGELGQNEPRVTYVTHLTKDFVLYISELVRFWEGPVSVAAFVPDGNPKDILDSILHFCYCTPEMSRVSLHFVFKKDVQPQFYLSRVVPPKSCDIQDLVEKKSEQNLSNSDFRNNSQNKALDNWYPINVCRNAARQAAYTDFILVSDVELMPSEGLASRFVDMTESYKCLVPECEKQVYVVPIFEVDGTEDVPRTKSQLISLISTKKAVYFHQLVCPHCQKFPGLEQWKETDTRDLIKPLIETRREVPYHRWEPIYIGTKKEPMYYEKLSWEGFQDKMLQMLEMCLAGYKLVVLDGAFLVHWPGIKKAKRRDEPWRDTFVKKNQDFYSSMLKNITSRYPANSHCKAQ